MKIERSTFYSLKYVYDHENTHKVQHYFLLQFNRRQKNYKLQTVGWNDFLAGKGEENLMTK